MAETKSTENRVDDWVRTKLDNAKVNAYEKHDLPETLTAVFKGGSKTGNKGGGIPDFTVFLERYGTLVVIENKYFLNKHIKLRGEKIDTTEYEKGNETMISSHTSGQINRRLASKINSLRMTTDEAIHSEDNDWTVALCVAEEIIDEFELVPMSEDELEFLALSIEKFDFDFRAAHAGDFHAEDKYPGIIDEYYMSVRKIIARNQITVARNGLFTQVERLAGLQEFKDSAALLRDMKTYGLEKDLTEYLKAQCYKFTDAYKCGGEEYYGI